MYVHRFLCTMAKVGKSDWEGTFAGTHGNDEDAPTTDFPATAITAAAVSLRP